MKNNFFFVKRKMQAVKQDQIVELIKSGQPLFTTVVPYFRQPYEHQVVITIGDNGELYWRYINSIPYSYRVELKLHSTNLYLNGQVLYIKPQYTF